MTALVLTALLALATTAPVGPTATAFQAVQRAEVIADVRVHGNHVATNEEVLALSGVAIGEAFTPETPAEVYARLKASGKFDEIEVLKRFASIVDPTQVTLIIIVNEGPVRLSFTRGPDGEDVAVVTRRWALGNIMYLPILSGEDGYGVTHGVIASLANVVGQRSRLSLPLSWGGTKRAALELEKNFASGPLTRVEVGSGVQRRTNPAYKEDDSRRRIWARAERAISHVHLGATAGRQRVTFGPLADTLKTLGADVTIDTRLNPAYPRNAVLATAAWERVAFDTGGTLHRTRLEGTGYLGLLGQTVLAARVSRDGTNGPQPAYLRPLLGGWSNLRGFKAGAFVGDIVVTGSVELFAPLTSPLYMGRLGVSAFVDTGTAYDYGQRLKDQIRYTGVGGSVWMTATVFRLSLSVAHGRGAGTRVNFGGGFTF
ncbi:MAG: BamA/TamA family outer membrane protein [Acidobacteria bacterium]|nr:BamA/TamA family outer membrane protein [Acidobacteriota bacterium]